MSWRERLKFLREWWGWNYDLVLLAVGGIGIVVGLAMGAASDG